MGNGAIEHLPVHSKTQDGLKFGLELMMKVRVGTIVPEGLSHLAEIPSDRPVVFAISHITDLDMPVAGSVLADRFNLGIAQISKLKKDPLNIVGMLFTGIHNYFPIQYGGRRGAWIPTMAIENYEIITKAMRDEGKAILFAAHNPTYNHVLPDRSGVGAVILANMADALVMPIAIDVQVADKFIGKPGASASLNMLAQRPNARVWIGKHLDFPRISTFNEWTEIMKERKSPINSDTRQLMKDVHEKIREQSDEIMHTIASMLPKEKRGVWGAKVI